MAEWPPTLSEYKTDRGIKAAESRDDAAIQQSLDAAVAFVQRVRPDLQYDPMDPDQWDKPEPSADVRLGVLRLAARWRDRVRSPDGMVNRAEMGAGRVSTFDGDIDRLLRIGRHARPRVG